MPVKNIFKYWTQQFFTPDVVLQEKYSSFKSLLSHDIQAHELMAELEEIYYNQLVVDFKVIEDKYDDFSNRVGNIIEDFQKICPTRYRDLSGYYKKFDSYTRFMLSPKSTLSTAPYVISLKEISQDDEMLVGGKTMHLSVADQRTGISIPKGFVITSNAFNSILENNDLRKPVDQRLVGLDINSTVSLTAVSKELTDLIMQASIPLEIEDAVIDAVNTIWPFKTKDRLFAIRSSAVREDSRASFAGQYRTVLNVGYDTILNAYKQVIASKYSPEAIYYRINFGLSDIETPMAVLCLEMIDARISGVMYTRDLQNPESDHMVIHSVRGLGDTLVSGQVTPDITRVTKIGSPEVNTGIKNNPPKTSSFTINNKPNRVDMGKRPKAPAFLSDKTVKILARWGVALESYFKEPQDIEWCVDRHDKLFLLQSRPLRTEEFSSVERLECNFDDIQNEVLLSEGETACAGIGAGKVYRVDNEIDLDLIPNGSVLVSRDASPSFVRVMKRLNAIITEKGSMAGHLASVAREFGVPALMNARNALENLPDGIEVTVYTDGHKVYKGLVPSLLESPCAQRNLFAESPFMRKLKYVIDFISPLRLIDPESDIFKPDGCRSMHDIIRFCHEKAVQGMFRMSDRRIRKIRGSKKLKLEIPMLVYVLDVGGGLNDNSRDQKSVNISEIQCAPLIAVLKGLNHPNIHWGDVTHFDWAEHDKIVLSGGIISPESAMFASHVIVSHDYANLNLKFGYHFVIVDALFGDQPQNNRILFRFSGGGADLSKRMLRADFLTRILKALDFEVIRKSDLVNAEFTSADRNITAEKLDMLGRLLGATRLMDMYLKDASMVDRCVDDFMNGKYHFGKEDQ
jgi:pyruvate,water dikinase